ncbi:hypothetical protein ACFOYW_06440 [Gryllotalpicola reticulitermitis]|uniref:Lipoprotein LpqN n=1 Tax=Gryllotalpicola reticulitermitis TaxID=1184153 RepID=A0ABV8Q5B1_9MICO
MPLARPALRLSAALIAGAATICLLAACAGTSGGSTGQASPNSTDASSAPSAGATDAGRPTPTFSPTPTPSPTPVTLTQDQVWTAQQVYSYNPNFTVDPDYKVQGGSAADQLVQLKGVSFGWLNETSNDIIEVAVAHPNSANVAQFDGSVAATSQQVPIDGAPSGTVSYFDVKNGVGTLQIFTNNGYWVVIDSKTFLEPGDSYQVASAVMGNLH